MAGKRVHVIHWRPAEAENLLQAVRAAGVQVSFCDDPAPPNVARQIREAAPEVVVIDLSRLPSHGKEVAVWLRNRKATRAVPLVFVGGNAEKTAKVRALLPDAIYTDLSGIAAVLKGLPTPLASAEPVAPLPMMQRYGNRTAAEKMGVKPGMKIAVMDAPRDYPAVLGDLPEGSELIEEPAAGAHDVTIWFAHDPEGLLMALPKMARMAGRTKLWVLWKKGSKNGITQNFVREAGIEAGLVDYKICSVNGVWSGIAFARSKK